MRKIGEYIKWYFYITTSILFVAAVTFSLAGAEALPAKTLWQVILSGLATTVVTVVINLTCSAWAVWGYLFHYIALSAVMVMLGAWFGWISLDLGGIAFMLVCVAIVYALVYLMYYAIDLREAKMINERLKEKNGEQEAYHE